MGRAQPRQRPLDDPLGADRRARRHGDLPLAHRAVREREAVDDHRAGRPRDRTLVPHRRDDLRRRRDVAVPGVRAQRQGRPHAALARRQDACAGRAAHARPAQRVRHVRRRRRDHARRSADRLHHRARPIRGRTPRCTQRQRARVGLPDRLVAGAAALHRHDRRPGVRARAAARREVLDVLRARDDRDDARATRRREPLAGADRRGRRHGPRHGRAGADPAQERRRRRARPRPRALDRPRAPRSLCPRGARRRRSDEVRTRPDAVRLRPERAPLTG